MKENGLIRHMEANDRQHEAILYSLNNISVKVGKVETHLKDMNGTLARHETDIGLIRKFTYKMAGGLAVLIFVLGFVVKFIGG